jgi:flagellar P-ring protein precursor FlgI
MIRFISLRFCLALIVFACVQADFVYSQSEFRIGDIVRLKGQEENVLQGLGLVVGLKGSGDGNMKPMIRALARSMQLMGGQVAADIQGRLDEKDIEGAKNVALVFVTATVPPAGAQPGDKLLCTISAINAKSLEGGNLMMTPLLGPRADQPTVFALAQGPIVLDSPKQLTTGRITDGCKMEAEVQTQYLVNDQVTLILETSQSSFSMAQQIEDTINDYVRNGLNLSTADSGVSSSQQENDAAIALDQMHVVVKIPPNYRYRPIQFISGVLDLPVVSQKQNKRVTIRQREGIIVIGDDVTIAPVAISHKNLTLSTRSTSPSAVSPGGNFVGLGIDKRAPLNQQTTLKQLVDALNLLAVPTEDIVSIIKAIDRQGNLYGELVID